MQWIMDKDCHISIHVNVVLVHNSHSVEKYFDKNAWFVLRNNQTDRVQSKQSTLFDSPSDESEDFPPSTITKCL